MAFYCLLPGFEVKVNGQAQSSRSRSKFKVKVKCLTHSNRYLGSVQQKHSDTWKTTMTHGIQSKISVCLLVIRKHSRSNAAHSGQGLLFIREWSLFMAGGGCRNLKYAFNNTWIYCHPRHVEHCFPAPLVDFRRFQIGSILWYPVSYSGVS